MSVYLKKITSIWMSQNNKYPFNIPAFSKWINIEIKKPVLLLVGENWSGKSTLLKAIADNCWFNPSWWNQHHSYGEDIENELWKKMRFSWLPKIKHGFFMRAENFLNFSDYLDQLAIIDSSIYEWYWGVSLNKKSHGEAFFSLFKNHFKKWIFILDEPESALSPMKQIAFLVLIKQLINNGAQFIIATHSPIVMGIPNAQVISVSDQWIREVWYKDTEHYQITKLFLECPDRFYKEFKMDDKNYNIPNHN